MKLHDVTTPDIPYPNAPLWRDEEYAAAGDVYNGELHAAWRENNIVLGYWTRDNLAYIIRCPENDWRTDDELARHTEDMIRYPIGWYIGAMHTIETRP